MPLGTANIAQHAELPAPEFIFGSSAGMHEIRRNIECALDDDLPVLIEGESGTGKEVIGRFLHHHSARGVGPFLKFNCAAVPANLIEEEMFGCGGASGSQLLKRGSVASAAGGTLFLDEITELHLGVQQRLTQMLKSGCYRHVDGSEDVPLHARIVCATRRLFDRTAARGSAGREILQGLPHHRVCLLPLRERKEDIPRLCEYLLARFSREFGRPLPRLSAYVLSVFQQWKWPGNIRELENWIARIVIFGTEEVIGLEFNRQLQGWQESLPRSHRATYVAGTRARRIRRHS